MITDLAWPAVALCALGLCAWIWSTVKYRFIPVKDVNENRLSSLIAELAEVKSRLGKVELSRAFGKTG